MFSKDFFFKTKNKTQKHKYEIIQYKTKYQKIIIKNIYIWINLYKIIIVTHYQRLLSFSLKFWFVSPILSIY